MEIKRSGSQPSTSGSAGYFTGTVRIDPLFQAREPARAAGASVTFEPGARTAWHSHPLGQTLIVVAGRGLVQSWEGPVREISPADVVTIVAGEKHWHGAAPTQRHDSHRHSGTTGGQDGRVDGEGERRTLFLRVGGDRLTSASNPSAREALVAKLKRSNEVMITVEGRSSGKKISTPVWFVMDKEDQVMLVPMKGSSTNWFKNLEKHPQIELSEGGKAISSPATICREKNQVERILDEFRSKYRSMWSESYYAKRDVYVEVRVQ